MKRIFFLLLLFGAVLLSANGQDGYSFEEYMAKKNADFDKYNDKLQGEFEDYRRKCNEEFADYLRKAWIGKSASPKKERPKDDLFPPVVFDDNKKDEIINQSPMPIPYVEVIPVPQPSPQPQPIEPIKEMPIPDQKPTPAILPQDKPAVPIQGFSFYGTPVSVRFDKSNAIKIGNLNENAIADAWLALSGKDYDNLIVDCLELREKLKLGDWAYLKMLKDMAESINGKNTDESVLLTAYVYCQSGYKMRLAFSEKNRLIMLFASKHTIFEVPYFNIDGDCYYCFENNYERIRFADVRFPKESSMSLLLQNEPCLTYKPGPKVTRVSKRYDVIKSTVCVNSNMLDFFTEYPNSKLGDNPVSRWAIYANVPLAKDVKDQLYPSLKKGIQNCSQIEAVNKLLNYVQTGFVYEYDDKVWGHDRAFFAEESLHYPYCDCEDRSILFSRLVRDLMDLNVILVYYPGHLATAVEFTDGVYGDYIEYGGKKFTVCDPTYIGAPVGMTMTDMDNAKAQVILLEKNNLTKVDNFR